MNIDNLNKLIGIIDNVPAHLVNMKRAISTDEKIVPGCGCVAFHYERNVSRTMSLEGWLGLGLAEKRAFDKLIMPEGWNDDEITVGLRYPKDRVISTLKRLRDTYLATGQVVVDWGPEPGEEPKTPWGAPQVAEVIAPVLPAEITSLLRPSAVKTEA